MCFTLVTPQQSCQAVHPHAAPKGTPRLICGKCAGFLCDLTVKNVINLQTPATTSPLIWKSLGRVVILAIGCSCQSFLTSCRDRFRQRHHQGSAQERRSPCQIPPPRLPVFPHHIWVAHHGQAFAQIVGYRGWATAEHAGGHVSLFNPIILRWKLPVTELRPI